MPTTTNYAPGVISTSTEVNPYDSPDSDMLDFWNEMGRSRRATRKPSGGFGKSSGAFIPARRLGGGTGEGGSDERMRQAQLRALEAKTAQERAQANALGVRAPMRTSFVGGQMVVTPDANAMTGAQRAVHLPGNSSFIPQEEDLADLDYLARMRMARGR